MASLSPQRPRKPQAHSSSQVPTQSGPPREMSPSPVIRDRQRAIKTQSMPHVPSVMQQMYASQNAQQPSPTNSTASHNSRRSPPAAPTTQFPPTGARVLPSPPRVNPVARDATPERGPPAPQYPRPVPRVQPPPFLFDNMERSWQMTDELLAEIERADQQQAQGAQGTNGTPNGGNAPGRPRSRSPHRDPGVERVRAGERASPKDPESRRTHAQSRDSRERHATPERHESPAYLTPVATPDEAAVGYAPFNKRASPPVLRRAPGEPHPAQMRTPDRSLPVQEEAEDDAPGHKNQPRPEWRNGAASPTPSSDLDPEGHAPHYEGGRDSRAGRDEDAGLEGAGLVAHGTDEEGFTPRSPVNTLPADAHNAFYPSTIRVKGRNATTDQLGLRGFDPAVFDQSGNIAPMGAHEGRSQEAGRQQDTNRPQDRKQDAARPDTSRQQEQNRQEEQIRQQDQNRQQEPNRQSDDRQSNGRQSNGHPADNGQYEYYSGRAAEPRYPPRIYPDEFQSFLDEPDASYIHAYLQSPRPNAPIPPTPHSQTAAPTPSPLVSSAYGASAALPPTSPVQPVGSPYPFPFSHVRRNHTYNGPPRVPTYDVAPSVQDIQAQMARQWQMYALNNQGAVSDSTFSPASTPYPGAPYNPWALLHTSRTLGARPTDAASLQSSPSHEPVPLPVPPSVGVKKRERHAARRPPPRVESTQPRETSPEPSSSGEETAGETFAAPEEGRWVHSGAAVDDGDWIDVDDEADEDDLLELEFHPSYVSNVEKRRRRWDTRWDALVQAFHALDRQTDATLVLLAAPSHSHKLHALASRAVRREPALRNSPALAGVRAGFRDLAAQRRAHRSHRASLAEALLAVHGPPTDGSESSAESREEDLKRALEAALGTLGAFGTIYEQREARWREEMRRVSDDREKVELLLRQALGVEIGFGQQMQGRAL